MGQGRPIEPDTRARIVELFGTEGYGRNRIAREVGVSASTVGLIAQEVGHEFDWSTTEIATAARVIQAAAIRENLAKALLLEAHRALDDLHAPAITFQFEAGHEVTEEVDGVTTTRHEAGSFREHVIPEPTFSDKRNIMTVVGIAISKAAEVSRPQAGQGAEEGISVLVGLARAIDKLAEGDLADVDPTEVPTGAGA